VLPRHPALFEGRSVRWPFRRALSRAFSAHIFRGFEHLNFKGFSLSELWDHTVRSGIIATVIMRAERADPAEVEEAHIAGMLHDLGKLMLADSMPDRFHQSITLAQEQGLSSEQAEMEVFWRSPWRYRCLPPESLGSARSLGRSCCSAPYTFTERPSCLRTAHCGSRSRRVLNTNFQSRESPALRPFSTGSTLAVLGLSDRLDAWREAVAEEFTSDLD